MNGSPKEGTIAEEMREARHRYHYAIRDVKRNEKNIRKAKMIECIALDRTRDLWKEYGKVNGKKRKLYLHIDNTQSKDINRMFANKYNKLLNSNTSDKRILEELIQSVKHDLEGYNGYDHVINVEQVFNAIHKLKKEKSDGIKGLWSNHLIYAPHIFKVHIALLLTSMHVHGYTPDDVLNGTIISLPKDGQGNKCDSDNYWEICTCSCLTKI